MRLPHFVRCLFVLGLFAMGGCTAPDLPAGQCRFDSDCDAPLKCVDLYCRQECSASQPCPAGQRCIVQRNAGVCVANDPAHQACRYTSDCPTTTFCTRDGVCQAQCITDYDCQVINPFQTCVSGFCTVRCAAATGDCDSTVVNGCETRTDRSVSNCGACGQTCPTRAHAATACTAGACQFRCDPGFADCDANPVNGCEVDLSTSEHCGTCDLRCPTGSTCAGRREGEAFTAACVTACDGAGRAVCAGACADLRTDPMNCGACGRACPTGPGGRAVCRAGVCDLACTAAGLANCNGTVEDGCEVDLTTSATSCGRCGGGCTAPAGATAGCAGAACTFACITGRGDCDRAAFNGCEVDLATSRFHCGMCGAACPARANATPTCAMGTCGFTCNAGFGDCDHDPTNGCERALTADTGNCGGCGTLCVNRINAAATCAMGTCGFTCNTGFADCDGDAANGCEVDLRSTPAHCGTCPNACAAGQLCVAGVCAASCTGASSRLCSGRCVDTSVDVANCGACSTNCPVPANATAVCSESTCGVRCITGFANCDGTAANGCEKDLRTSPTDCGSCGRACGARQYCAAGVCQTFCDPGQAFCGESCVNILTNVSACGGCGVVCAPANATPACTTGRCGFSECDFGFDSCDGNEANGCETELGSLTACSRCGENCATALLHVVNPTCQNGKGYYCAYDRCQTGWYDANFNSDDGCESDTPPDGGAL